MSPHAIVNPASLPKPRGYSHAVVTPAGRMIFVAGQVGCDAGGAIASPDLVAQFELALANAAEAVRAAGGAPGSIARLTIYVVEMAEYRSRLRELGEAYRRVMGRHYPAMAVLEVKGLFDPGAKVELEATAVL